MMTTVLFYLLLFLSLLINIGAAWYVREMLKQMRVYYDIFSDLNFMIKNYRNHLDAVYELDMFYGDTTLSELLRHTRDLSEDIQQYVRDFPFDDVTEIRDEDNLEQEEV